MEEDLIGNVTVVISDFGLAKKEIDMEHTQCGSPAYMAPEVLDGQLYDEKVDIFSLGVVFYKMLTGKLPFPAKSINEL